MAFLTTTEAASLTGYSAAHLRDLCASKQIKGAEKKGKTWLAPETTWRKLADEKATQRPGPKKKS